MRAITSACLLSAALCACGGEVVSRETQEAVHIDSGQNPDAHRGCDFDADFASLDPGAVRASVCSDCRAYYPQLDSVSQGVCGRMVLTMKCADVLSGDYCTSDAAPPLWQSDGGP